MFKLPFLPEGPFGIGCGSQLVESEADKILFEINFTKL
jgi:hypothetical protein